MKNEFIDEFLGKLCKVLIKDNFRKKTHTITGVIIEIDKDEGSIAIQTTKGLFYLKIELITSVKEVKEV